MPNPMKLRRSTVLPAILTIYLAVMAYIGRGELRDGNYLYYFGVIAITLACIVLLRLNLLRREKRADRKRNRGN